MKLRISCACSTAAASARVSCSISYCCTLDRKTSYWVTKGKVAGPQSMEVLC
ncbi:hypothetical protein PF005_g20518 [Phytophthora fragariae]|uniref:Uncharacterized protein n=1 Tax=Phytophthora fragariae TaxID=53985 RepID=A0A6A3E2T2_9STRA|nr:hypothetical protein PF003_g12454 [Phytophthora fragariae]KAE8928142.1 hypothetical protein PF009_g21705 [Phytophthora fragariae]KAE8988395.1 hypothetical protein PF011_g19188 [Phytophthora fragariae]KAE9107365.1 hypothetical protein PF007_g13064 [Phytophthora fragariae]KAE9113608.1 hypothetical protein PF006_g19705 [Phytophthora fragariae]